MKTSQIINNGILVFILLFICLLTGCYVEHDCDSKKRNLTNEEKNIFNYKVGDSIVFTDGTNDYYIKCLEIFEEDIRIYHEEDEFCKGGYQNIYAPAQFIGFKSNIPFSDTFSVFNIVTLPEYHMFLFCDFNCAKWTPTSSGFSINHDAFINIDTNTYESGGYVGSYEIGNNTFKNVYRLTLRDDWYLPQHNLIAILVCKETGLLFFETTDGLKLNLKVD